MTEGVFFYVGKEYPAFSHLFFLFWASCRAGHGTVSEAGTGGVDVVLPRGVKGAVMCGGGQGVYE